MKHKTIARHRTTLKHKASRCMGKEATKHKRMMKSGKVAKHKVVKH
jgi:hypothetical protein